MTRRWEGSGSTASSTPPSTLPLTDPFWASTEELGDVPEHLLREIQHFFAIYKDLEGKKTVVEGWDDRNAAEEVTRESRQRFQARQRRYHHP